MLLKKWTLLMISTMLIANALGQRIVEDANVVERQLGSSFNAIKVNGNMEVWLSQDAVQSLAVSADQVQDRDAIQTEVREGVLHISGGISKKSSKGRVYISFKSLEKVEVGGVTSLKVIGSIRQTSLTIAVSGVSDFDGAVSLENLEADLSGVSKINIKGKVLNANVNCSGSSKFEGLELEAETCKANASGSADISITATGQLTVTASGSSEVFYRGQPSVVDENLSGSASLKKKDK